MSQADVLIEKINKREAVVAVCGLGYVGLPLVMAFNKQGFKVIGFDIDQKKVEKLHKGESYIKHIDFKVIKQNVDAGRFVATTDFKRIGELWSVRVGLHYRALGVPVADGVLWFWIGSHDEYERLLNS